MKDGFLIGIFLAIVMVAVFQLGRIAGGIEVLVKVLEAQL